MNIETSTLNLLLGSIVALQVFIIKELFSLKTKLAVVLSRCPYCKRNMPNGTDSPD